MRKKDLLTNIRKKYEDYTTKSKIGNPLTNR